MNEELKKAPNAVEIKPLREKVNFSMEIPGSKSIANRVLLLAAMAQGPSVIAGIPDNDDSQAALSVVEALGIRTEKLDNEMYRIHGCGHDIPNRSGDLDIRSAGTVGRFLPGLLASSDGGEWRLVSTPQLARRPIAPLVDGLRQLGADIAYEEDGKSFPMRVRGTGLKGGTVEVSAKSSSQFASGLLMCAPFAAEDPVINIQGIDPQESYVDITMGVMRYFGADISYSTSEEGDRLSVTVKAPAKYRAADLRVEADLNSALMFLILPLMVGGRATVTNVSGETAQPGNQLLKMFSRLRGIVKIGRTDVSVASGGTPKGGFEVDMRAMSEMALAMGVLAIFADEPITMTNLGHIRNHETDRLSAISELLGQVGVKTEEGDDWVKVYSCPREELKNVTIDSRDDHRVVMAFSLLGLAGNGITITNASAVSKTFPDFFERLQAIGAEITAVED